MLSDGQASDILSVSKPHIWEEICVYRSRPAEISQIVIDADLREGEEKDKPTKKTFTPFSTSGHGGGCAAPANQTPA